MTHSTKPISPLRQRMLEDMALRKLAPKTQSNYLRAVINFTCFLGAYSGEREHRFRSNVNS